MDALRRAPRRAARPHMAALRDMAADFVAAAERYGRIVVAERHCAAHAKTVRPAALGGVAGGEKYVVHNILFKFALDQQRPNRCTRCTLSRTVM